MERPYDIVVYGATGYTGEITCEYIARKLKNEKWAIAGRSKQKLDQLKSDLKKISPNADPDIITCDASNYDDIKSMVSKAKVVISFVGPYRLYGEPIVKACVECGTDYVDATGEPPFVSDIIAKYHDTAKQKKLYLLPAAGVGSLITDIAVEIVKESFAKEEKSKVVNARGYVKYNGRHGKTFSNGTWGTFLNSMSSKPQRTARSGAPSGEKKKRVSRLGTHYYSANQTWAFPFVEGADLSIIRRTNDLTLDKNGDSDFNYSQYTQIPFFPPLWMIWTLLTVAIMMFFAKFSFVKNILKNRQFPAGGPTKEQRADTSVEVYVDGQDDQKRKKKLHLACAGPYDSTGYACAEAAFVLVHERDQLNPVYGIVTPASVMSSQIQKRLKERAGVTWSFQ